MTKTRLELALYKGHPLKGGQELTYPSYTRVTITDISAAVHENMCWGVINTAAIEFPVPKEPWEGITHVAVISQDIPLLIACDTMDSELHFFDNTTAGLDLDEGVTVATDEKIVCPPYSLFVYAGLLLACGPVGPKYRM